MDKNDKEQNNIQTEFCQLEDVGGKRTSALQKRLKDVDILTDEQIKNILPKLSN